MLIYVTYVIIDERKKWNKREFFKYTLYYEVDYFLYMDMVKKMKRVLFKEAICMEQKLTLKIEVAFFIIMALSGIVILIFCLRRENDRKFDWETFERTVRMMHEQTNENLDMLTKMNKKKDELEEKIRDKKKNIRNEFS